MNKKLFVRNLSWNVSEDDLFEVFGSVGDVVSVKIPLRREDNKPRGFAFIEMGSAELAQSAINQLNGSYLDDRELSVDFSDEERSSGRSYQNSAPKNSKLFIRNISNSVSEYDLENLFNQSGNVVSVKIPVDRDTGYQRPFGFVEMNSVSEAENAINELNNTEIGGQAITVAYQKEKEDRKPRRQFNRY